MLNVFANELQLATQGKHLDEDCLLMQLSPCTRDSKGSYAVVCMISGHGLVAFRDPHGLRPLCIGTNTAEDGTTEYMVASESVALEGSEFKLLRDVEPGEAIWIDEKATFIPGSVLKKSQWLRAFLSMFILLVRTLRLTAFPFMQQDFVLEKN